MYFVVLSIFHSSFSFTVFTCARVSCLASQLLIHINLRQISYHRATWKLTFVRWCQMVIDYQRVSAGAGSTNGSFCIEVLSINQNFFAVPSAVTRQSKLENGVIQLVTRKPRWWRLWIMSEAFGNFFLSKSNWPYVVVYRSSISNWLQAKTLRFSNLGRRLTYRLD